MHQPERTLDELVDLVVDSATLILDLLLLYD
jgi:hypothetical protein